MYMSHMPFMRLELPGGSPEELKFWTVRLIVYFAHPVLLAHFCIVQGHSHRRTRISDDKFFQQGNTAGLTMHDGIRADHLQQCPLGIAIVFGPKCLRCPFCTLTRKLSAQTDWLLVTKLLTRYESQNYL